jgi:hypothetical protein
MIAQDEAGPFQGIGSLAQPLSDIQQQPQLAEVRRLLHCRSSNGPFHVIGVVLQFGYSGDSGQEIVGVAPGPMSLHMLRVSNCLHPFLRGFRNDAGQLLQIFPRPRFGRALEQPKQKGDLLQLIRGVVSSLDQFLEWLQFGVTAHGQHGSGHELIGLMLPAPSSLGKLGKRCRILCGANEAIPDGSSDFKYQAGMVGCDLQEPDFPRLQMVEKLGADAILDKAVRLTREQSLARRLEGELDESVGFLLAEYVVKTVTK